MAPSPSGSGWRRHARRPVVIGGIVAVLFVVGGATAWATGSSASSGYRMTTVVHTTVATSLDVVGTVEPVNDASASFQVAGKVATVTAAVGDTVTAGQTLASLDPTALNESVSSAQSSLSADEAKLTADENGQTSSSASTSSTPSSSTPSTSRSASTTAALTSYTVQSGSSASSGGIAQDQATLVTDQHQESMDQQQEAADLAQAQSICGTSGTPTTTPTTPDPSGCAAALAKASADEQKVSKDQQTVATDETTLANALAAAASSPSTPGSPPTGGSGGSGASGSSGKSSPSSSGSSGGSGSGTGSASNSTSSVSNSAQQIASDQAAIDAAQATLIEAQQQLNDTQLTSPINGTIASVGVTVGDTVTAGSSTSVFVIIGTQSYQVTGTLTSTQVQSVKVGYTAQVAVDGTTGTLAGTVAQVGPVLSSSSGYTYPAVVALPTSARGLYAGSTANASIRTSEVKDVLALPTSAVMTRGTRSYVLVLSSGSPVEKTIKVGIVGDIYTQVRSGLHLGSSVVLADAIPSPSLRQTRRRSGDLAAPPVLVAAVASGEAGGSKAAAVRLCRDLVAGAPRAGDGGPR